MLVVNIICLLLLIARRPKCGNFIKLILPSFTSDGRMARLIAAGKVKNIRYIENPQGKTSFEVEPSETTRSPAE